jgi:hypothetical protein
VRDGRQQVVILYSHPLLGEGLGRLLAGDADLEVELVRVGDMREAETALAGSPDVVILERTPPLQAIDLMRLAPSSLVIDVGLDAGPSWAYRRDELSGQPDELLQVIHARVRTVPADLAVAAGGADPAPTSAAARVAAALRGARA